jgi:hypothetical protein
MPRPARLTRQPGKRHALSSGPSVTWQPALSCAAIWALRPYSGGRTKRDDLHAPFRCAGPAVTNIAGCPLRGAGPVTCGCRAVGVGRSDIAPDPVGEFGYGPMPGMRRGPGVDRRRRRHWTLGTRLVLRLAEQGLVVQVLTRDPARAHHLAGPAVEVIRGDVRDRDPGSVTAAVQRRHGDLRRARLRRPRRRLGQPGPVREPARHLPRRPGRPAGSCPPRPARSPSPAGRGPARPRPRAPARPTKLVSAGTNPWTPPASAGGSPGAWLRPAAGTCPAWMRPRAAATNSDRASSARPSVGQPHRGVLAGRAVDAPLQVTDRPRAQARRLGQLLLRQAGSGPQLPQQPGQPRGGPLRHDRGTLPPPVARPRHHAPRGQGPYRHYPGQPRAPPFPAPASPLPGPAAAAPTGARHRRARPAGWRGPAGLPRDLVTPPASAVTGAILWVSCGPQA